MPDARSTNHTNTPASETLRLARPETIVEARPSDATPNAEEMFLSPRVLDAGAFSRYADTLKSLISDARRGARDLQDFAADADAINARCEQTGEALKVRVEAGARIVKMIDERTDRTEGLLETIRGLVPDPEALRAQAESAAREAVAGARASADAVARGIEAKADTAVSDATRRLQQMAQQIEDRLRTVAERAAEQADRLERASAAIDARIEAAEGRLASLAERTEQTAERTTTELEPVLDRANEAANMIEERIAAAGDAAARLGDEISGTIRERIDAASERAATELTPVLDRADRAASMIEERITIAGQTAEQLAQEISGRVREQIRPAEQICERVLERLSIDPDNPDTHASLLDRLDELVRRSEASLGTASTAMSRLDELGRQAERARSDFGTWLLEAATNLDILEARREKLVGPLADAADRIARVSPTLTDDLEAAALRLDHLQTEQAILREAIQTSSVLARNSGETLNNQAAQLQALIDGAMRTLTVRVEQAGDWLGGLIARAEGIAPASGIRATHQSPTVEIASTTGSTTVSTPTHTPEPTPGTAAGPSQIAEAGVQPIIDRDIQPEATTMQTRTDISPTTTESIAQDQSSADLLPRYGLPTPPALPIDAVSFDGAEVVYGRDDDLPQSAD